MKFPADTKKYMFKILSRNDGYFAVTVAIIMSVLVLMVSVSLSLRSFNTRLSSLDFESKDKSYSLARACIEEAAITLRASSTYSGSETITVGSSTCEVLAITDSGTDKIIPTEAEINNKKTSLEALFRSSTRELIYVRELES